MALPIAGSWSASNAGANTYTGATRWGTGYNPVHEQSWEGPPLRTAGRLDGPNQPTPQLGTVPESYEDPDLYGYTMEDITAPSYAETTPPYGTDVTVLREHAGNLPDWGVIPTDPERTQFQQDPELSSPFWNGTALQSFPTETVSEGWLNKTSGAVENAHTSDPSQYERQTSMQQVNPAPGRNNDLAVQRGTDSPRFNIMTRLTGKKIKPWSTGERLQDMFPFQQDTLLRPFWYRTAGTDNPDKLAPNEMYVSDPIQREVPPDPYLGPDETSVAGGYGYTPEDGSYTYA
jgi:hypothetical protein